MKKANIHLFPGKLFYSPEWLVLGVNNLCNLHCKMCDVGTQYDNSNFYTNLVGTHPINMPLELIEKILDQAEEYFPGTKIGYAFTEPLIYPHLIESLAYANKKGIYTTITTNALTLRQKAGKLVDAGLNEIFISLDGPPDVHNFIRGNKKSFEKAMEGIRELMKYPDRPEISIYCCITEWNVSRLAEFADLFSDLPIKEMGFMHTNFTTTEMAENHNLIWGNKYPATISNMEEVETSAMDLKALAEEIDKIKGNNYPFNVVFAPELNTPDELETYYHHPEKKIGKRCNDIFRNIMIKSDGSVIPAHGRCYNLSLGNLNEQELPEIWNSDIAAGFRKDILKAGGLMPACTRCCSAF